MSQTLSETEIEKVFVEHHGELQRAVQRRVRNPDEAADLVQDLWFKLHKLADRLPNATEARYFLLRMAANAGKDHVAKAVNRHRLLEGLVVLYDTAPEDAEAQLARRQEREQLEAAMGQLTDRQRDMLRRSRLLGEEYKEIARAWNCSVRTVEYELAAALKKMRAQLPRRGGANLAASPPLPLQPKSD
jgi:RNA polymerase sigma-70 factor (ECF subfamily)